MSPQHNVRLLRSTMKRVFGPAPKLHAFVSPPARHFAKLGLPQARRNLPTNDPAEAFWLGALAGMNSILAVDFGIDKAAGAWIPGNLGNSRKVLCDDWNSLSSDLTRVCQRRELQLDPAVLVRLKKLRDEAVAAEAQAAEKSAELIGG